jgi:hypothetical protein
MVSLEVAHELLLAFVKGDGFDGDVLVPEVYERPVEVLVEGEDVEGAPQGKRL